MSDQERALLFLYTLQVGLPPWAQHPRGQIVLLAKLMDWTEDRAEAALLANESLGFADKDGDPLDAVIVG